MTNLTAEFLCSDVTDMQETVDDVEDKLFSKIHNNPSHVLALFLPERRFELAYSLYTRRHHRTLSQRSAGLCDNNFITRQLFKDTY